MAMLNGETNRFIEGNRIGDIGFAVQDFAERVNGYGVVRELVGHGVGIGLHEPPEVPNYGKRGRGIKLLPGLVIAIEPMVNAGTGALRIMDDGWTAKTADGDLSAHFEHTVIVGKTQAEIIT